MKKFDKDKLVSGVIGYGFWAVYAGLTSAVIYGTIKKEVHTLLEMKRGYR